MKETNFINIIKNQLPSSACYIGDDTAFIPERDLVLTQDTLIEDVHFRKATISPYDLGIKSVAVNLSDIAAAGAIPEFMLVSLSLPPETDEDFVKEFYRGINDICSKYGVLTVGGDITGADKVYISITMIGKSEKLIPGKRSNAKVGDYVITTGEFGSSRAGLYILEETLKNSEALEDLKEIQDDVKNKFIKAHVNPVPQLKIGRQIAELSQPSPTIMDTSDGLADALYKICAMSGVSMEIDPEKIPYDTQLTQVAKQAKVDPLKWIFFGGEDYQLTATVSEKTLNELSSKEVDFTVIGKVVASDGFSRVKIKKEGKFFFEITQESLDNNCFNHFASYTDLKK